MPLHCVTRRITDRAHGSSYRRGVRGILLFSLVACVHPSAAGRAVVTAPTAADRNIPISVTARGFEPDAIDVTSGEPVTIVFTRTVERTCVKRVVLEIDDEHDVQRDLPIGQPIAITVAFEQPGELGFSCAMAMKGGAIHVHPRR